ncbi:hypothetical protein A5752_06215 [Mycobacterium sp. 852002-51961_SCH5331710]|nr:hypothetical protein A5752_06215 [Mycobacterium sp. 852002-51961_SCH5331710]
MARAVATIPPNITIPGLVGGRTSLNLFIGSVGPSGTGKGAADAASVEGIQFDGPRIEQVPIGTGEGVARTFRPIGTKPDDPNPVTNVIFTCPEIDTWAALAARSGATLSAETRKLYSGEQLGFGNAGKDTRVIVEAHSYRACLIAGVQPLRSQTLLGAADGGLPQRFVWLPVTDPDAPDDPPEDPGVWKVQTPSWGRDVGHLRVVGGNADLKVPESARTAIDNYRLAVLREDHNVDPLDGHRLLCQLKVAVALMALDGRTIVDDTDWKLSGYVMDVSAHTRERCRRALVEQSRNQNTARALATAEREEIISDRKLQRCKEGILRTVSRLPDQQLIPHNQLRRSLKSDVRDYFDAAINELITERRITAARTAKGPTGTLYGGPPVDHPSTLSEQRKQEVDHRSTVDPNRPQHRRRERNKYRNAQQTGEQTA